MADMWLPVLQNYNMHVNFIEWAHPGSTRLLTLPGTQLSAQGACSMAARFGSGMQCAN